MTGQVGVERDGLIHRPGTGLYSQVATFTNCGGDLATPLRVVLRGLPAGDALAGVSLVNPDTGNVVPLQVTHSASGDPEVVVPAGVLASLPAGQSFQLAFQFRVENTQDPFDYDTGVFSDNF